MPVSSSKLLFGILLSVTTARGQNSIVDPRGIYVYTEHLAQDAQAVNQALAVPGVDGLTLLLGWASLEPARGQYQWSQLDQWTTTAMQSNKKIALAVRAGQDTPCWLFQAPSCGSGYSKPYAGAAALTFSVSPREGVGQSSCNSETIAAPWDPAFLAEWDSLLAAVAAHLKSAGTYAAVTSVRLTGINRTTSELRLPAEILSTPCVANSVRTWLQANYRSSALLSAWDKLTDSFLRNFPDKQFGVEIIPTASGDSNLEYPFPAIDDGGCAYQPPWPANASDPNYAPAPCLNSSPTPDQDAPLLALASQKFSGRLSVSYQNLDLNQPPQPYVAYAAQTWGTAAGFQTNDYNNFQSAACSGGSAHPGPCTSASYLALLELGIYPSGKNNSLRAEYIEVLPPDAISFPSAIQQAHAELVAAPVLTPGSVANGATYAPGGLVAGSWAQVKGANLSTVSRTWAASDLAGLGNGLPTNLSGTSVTVNGLPAAVSYVSPGQVNFQVPAGVAGTASVQVANHGTSSTAATGAVTANAPGVIPIIIQGTNYAAGLFLDGKVTGDPSAGPIFRNAKPGDIIQLFATGLTASPAGTHVNVQPISGVTVTLGTITVPADAAALVGPGEFQINFTVPPQFANLAPGNCPVAIAINGVSSPSAINSNPPGPVVIPIQH